MSRNGQTTLLLVSVATLIASCDSLLGVSTKPIPTSTPKDMDAKDVFAAVSDSIVVVLAIDSQGKAFKLGSGVVIDKDVIVTNYHVVQGATAIQVKQGNVSWSAKFSKAHPYRDLSLATVESLKLPNVKLGTTSTLRVGEKVFAIGAPEGLELTLSEGLVSSLRNLGSDTVIQTSAPISRGSSGGGLFNTHAELVGITSAGIDTGQNLNFAVPVEWVSDLKKQDGQYPTGQEAGSLAGKFTFNGLTPSQSLTAKVKEAGSASNLPDTTTADPENQGVFFFTGSPSIVSGRDYQFIWSDSGELVTSTDVNTISYYASDPVRAESSKPGSPQYTMDLKWAVKGFIPTVNGTYAGKFQWSKPPGLSQAADFYVQVATLPVGQDPKDGAAYPKTSCWVSQAGSGSSATWPGRCSAEIGSSTGTPPPAGSSLYYRVIFVKPGTTQDLFAKREFHGRTAWVPFSYSGTTQAYSRPGEVGN